MSSGREWRESLAEFTRAAGDGIRQCLDLADDLKDEEYCEIVGDVRQQLLAIVKLDREVSHLEAALQHVEAVADNAKGVENEEGPPELTEEMEKKLTQLTEEDVSFDPTTHPSAQEFSEILTGGNRGESEEEEVISDDVHVGKVQVSLKCPLTSCYLEDPVSNPQCGHTYSKAAVIRHVNIQLRAGSTARCPVCSGPLSKDTLKPEPALADKARRAQRRRSRQPQDSIIAL